MAAVVAQQLAAHRNSKHEDGFPFQTNMALLACGATSTVAKLLSLRVWGLPCAKTSC